MTKAEQLRLVTFRSKFLEHAKRIDNVAATCRYFGISRPKFYKWKKRFDELGAGGLGDRPRTPKRCPHATPRAVVSKVLYLRQNYHFGAGRIRDYLKRFHDIRIAAATVQRLLHKHGLGRLPANQKHKPHGKRWQRYEKPQPGHRLQMDVKFLERIPGSKKRLYQFTAIDDCTRIRVLKVYDACNQATAIDFVDEVLRRLPFRIQVVQTDNGSEFKSKFHWHLDDLDIRHVFIRPRTPRLNGKVERSHRIDNDEPGEQLALGLPPPKGKHGGRRAGAGRPRSGRRSEAPHRARPPHKRRHPVHVVLRAMKDVPRLRTDRMFKAIRVALRTIGARCGFRVVHASIQRTHLHFLVEAEDKSVLTRGVRALAIALARRINAACGRRGKVFARYHSTVITSPRQARNALAYVLNNWRHHREDEGSLASRTAALDPYATGYAFDGWREAIEPPGFGPLPALSPETWLLRVGWRKHAPLSVREVPSN